MAGAIGYGSKLSVGRGTGNTWTYAAIVGLQDVNLPEITAEEIDVTSMDSPGKTREYISGLSDAGEVSVEANWIPGNATDVLFREIKDTGETVRLKFEVPQPGSNVLFTETWVGFCKGLTRTAPISDKMTISASFKISGKLLPKFADA